MLNPVSVTFYGTDIYDVTYEEYEKQLLEQKPSAGAVVALAFHWIKKTVPTKAETNITVLFDIAAQQVLFTIRMNGTKEVGKIKATEEVILDDITFVAAEIAFAAEKLYHGAAYSSDLAKIYSPPPKKDLIVHPVVSKLQTIFPVLDEEIECPAGCGAKQYVRNIIPHLNDVFTNGSGHGWTREEIAKWLEDSDLDIGVKNADS